MTDRQSVLVDLARAAVGRRPGPAADLRSLRTVGVEEELLLVDTRTGTPQPLAAAVLAGRRPATSRGRLRVLPDPSLEAELQQEQLEIASPPRTDLVLLRQDLQRLRRQADEAARGLGARVAALATSPLPATAHLTARPRYEAILTRFGRTCEEALTCGCHVHVAVASDEEGVAVIDRIRRWLPVLAALAAASPFSQGMDSGYASYRTQLQSRWPGAGPSELFGSARVYHDTVRQMLKTVSLLDEGMVYFDARLSRHYPTVEVRVADVTPDVDTTVLVAALTRALVDTASRAWRSGEPAPPVPQAVLQVASWRASRFGLDEGTDGGLVDPDDGTVRPAPEVLDRLLAHVDKALWRSGDQAWAQAQVDRLVSNGTGAQRQRLLVAAGHPLAAVVRDAVEQTVS